MKVFHSINQFKSKSKTVVTLGTFDGVHVGHKKIIERLLFNAKELNCESLVLTFFPHPRMVLQKDADVKLLNSIEEKAHLLSKTGLDNLVIHPFDQAFSRLTAEEFVKNILVDCFNVKKIIIGHDHRFGRNRTANIDDLIAFSKIYGFEVEQISAQEINDVAVSSTKIRNAILDGNIDLANNYLNYNYSFKGKIVKGKQIGRTIGFPTANFEIDDSYKLIPKNGVYVVESLIDQNRIFGMMNIGFNPTVGENAQTIEVYYFDFNGDLYEQQITVSILHRLRSEHKFDSLEALKNQLKSDQMAALDFIKKQDN